MATFIKQEEIIDLQTTDDEESDNEEQQVVKEEEQVTDDAESQDESQEDAILKIPDDKLPEKLIFRPGYQVLCLNYDEGALPKVVYATVKSAGVDLGNGSMGFVYTIQCKSSGEMFNVKEARLHFTQGTPVWAKIATEYEEGVIFSSSQSLSDEQVVYSVSDSASQRLHINVPARFVRYCAIGSNKPIDTDNTIEAKYPCEETTRIDNQIPADIITRQVSILDDVDLEAKLGSGATNLQTVVHNNSSLHSKARPLAEVEVLNRNLQASLGRVQRRIMIPQWANYRHMKGRIIGKGGTRIKSLEKHLDCLITWKDPHCEVFHLSFIIEASMEAIEGITEIIEAEMLKSVDSNARSVMLYDYTQLNAHFCEVDSEAIKAPRASQNDAWIAVLRLSKEIEDATFLLQQIQLNPIRERFDCIMQKVSEGIPHIYVSGGTSAKVNACYSEARDQLQHLLRVTNNGNAIVRRPLQDERCNTVRHTTPTAQTFEREQSHFNSVCNSERKSGHELSRTPNRDRLDMERLQERRKRIEGRWEPPTKRRKSESLEDQRTPISTFSKQTERIIRIPRSANYNAVIQAMKGDLMDEARTLRIRCGHAMSRDNKNNALSLDITATGIERCIKGWIHTLKTAVQSSADQGDKLRVMHEFMVANEDELNINDAVYLEPPFSWKITWIAVVFLPRNSQTAGRVAGRFSGRHRIGIEPIETETKCTIKLVWRYTKSPHVYVLGDNAEKVNLCRKLVQKRISLLTSGVEEPSTK